MHRQQSIDQDQSITNYQRKRNHEFIKVQHISRRKQFCRNSHQDDPRTVTHNESFIPITLTRVHPFYNNLIYFDTCADKHVFKQSSGPIKVVPAEGIVRGVNGVSYVNIIHYGTLKIISTIKFAPTISHNIFRFILSLDAGHQIIMKGLHLFAWNIQGFIRAVANRNRNGMFKCNVDELTSLHPHILSSINGDDTLNKDYKVMHVYEAFTPPEEQVIFDSCCESHIFISMEGLSDTRDVNGPNIIDIILKQFDSNGYSDAYLTSIKTLQTKDALKKDEIFMQNVNKKATLVAE